VRDFEMKHRTPIANNIAAIQRAIEEAGVELVFDADGNPTGVALKSPK
jgi:hypothetical protein